MANINNILDSIGQRGAIARNRPPTRITPTRLPALNDKVMKIGGVAGGRVYELYAPHSAGKSTLAQIICGDYQKAGKVAAYIDAESATQTDSQHDDKLSWMENLGVDVDQLIMPNFSTAEDCYQIVKTLIVNGVNLIVIDTVAVLRTEIMVFRAQETPKMNENMALAKSLTTFFNDIVSAFSLSDGNGNYFSVPADVQTWLRENGISIRDPQVHKLSYYDCAVIGVNHAKTMVGVLYGDPTYTPGGDSLGFHSHVRLGMTKPTNSKDKVKVGSQEVPEYRKTRVVAAKNKLAAPFGEMTLKVYQDGRVFEDTPFWEIAESKDLIRTTARTVVILEGKYKGSSMKKAAFEQWVAENPEFLELIDDKVEASPDATEAPPPAEIPGKKISLGLTKKDESQSKKLSLKIGFNKDV